MVFFVKRSTVHVAAAELFCYRQVYLSYHTYKGLFLAIESHDSLPKLSEICSWESIFITAVLFHQIFIWAMYSVVLPLTTALTPMVCVGFHVNPILLIFRLLKVTTNNNKRHIMSKARFRRI